MRSHSEVYIAMDFSIICHYIAIMKRMYNMKIHFKYLIVIVSALIVNLPVQSLAAWVLYDDFSSGKINTNKWIVDNSSGNISVENGKVKFEQFSGHPNDGTYLKFKYPEYIKGIKVTVRVDSYSGDFQPRLGAHVGTTPSGDWVWSAMDIEPKFNEMWGYAGIERPPSWEWQYKLFGSAFRNPITTVGQEYTLTMDYSKLPKITYSVEGLGSFTFTIPADSVSAAFDEQCKIGTKSSDGNGYGTAYFDKVYINGSIPPLGWVIAIDGMDRGASFYSYIIPTWPDDMPTMYLYEAITSKWRKTITNNVGNVVSFTWTRNLWDTEDAVQKLYEQIKDYNNTNRPVIVLSHSWGTVLAYIALKTHNDIYIDKLITLGSPLDSNDPVLYEYIRGIWFNKYGIAYQVSKPDNIKEWHNYWSLCDPIAESISGLAGEDNYMIKKLYWNPFACHSSYFDDDNKWEKILSDIIDN